MERAGGNRFFHEKGQIDLAVDDQAAQGGEGRGGKEEPNLRIQEMELAEYGGKAIGTQRFGRPDRQRANTLLVS